MAVISPTGLEDHTAGTTNVGGIINGNWTRLNQIFDAALSTADAMFNQFVKALMRNATLPTDAARMEWDATAGTPKLVWRAGYALLTWGATTALDFAGARSQKLPITGVTTFTTSNKAVGRDCAILMVGDTVNRALTFPAGWLWTTAVPANITALKNAVLTLRSTTTADTGVWASYAEQP